MNKEISKILIVDDNPKNLQLLGTILEKNNYYVEYAQSGFEALEWIKSEKFDLILLDVMMPEIDGFEVCSIIRKEKEYNNIPIIFLTAKSDKESILKGFKLHAQDYIGKPFDKEELLARIKTHIELKKSKRKLKDVNIWLENEVNKKTLELKQANERLEETLTELQNLDQMKSYFLNLTSIEIRAPLTGILGTVHLLKNQEVAFAIKDYLNLLENSINKLEKFANKAILTTELSSRSYDFKLEKIDIKEIINFSLLELNDLINLKEIDYINEVENITLNIDKELIKKAIVYLVQNAIDHSNSKSRIHIKSKKTEDKLYLQVIDFGRGFQQDVLDNIYSPFRFNEKDFQKSTELSMYLVKLIMDIHKGGFRAFNIENAGACVELAFKLK